MSTRSLLRQSSLARPASEDGYELWLRHPRVTDRDLRAQYRSLAHGVWVAEGSRLLETARRELARGFEGLLGQGPTWEADPGAAGLRVEALRSLGSGPSIPTRSTLSDDGFEIRNEGSAWVIAGGTERGALYGVFHLLRELGLGRPLSALATREVPRIGLRMLEHWDNPGGTVERGYAGSSLWKWRLLPGYLDPRYRDYARAMASLGLNATSLINVNSDARILTPSFLEKVGALAEIFRDYGLRVFLTARFSAPSELGDTNSADPRAPEVQAWWQQKARDIYQLVPDFGGFLVKANSEGQPGPKEYGRSHAEGANLLARAVAPFGGRVIWRAFVYDHEVPADRTKQAYDAFLPLDGQFDDNVLVQIKNGPLDFQPREPFHPLFGALARTATLLELQLTQEYLGQETHLVYLAPYFREVLASDTHARGAGSTVATAIDGSLHGGELTGIAAVSNVGDERNWCGHPFAQANWYAFGRLAWNPDLAPETLAREWLALTFTQKPQFVDRATRMMLESHAICANTMTPLGLHHVMAKSHHKGPGPWVDEGRLDWTAVYYHRASPEGIGFDRTASGSDALAQYTAPVRERFANPKTCPRELLLWFHRVAWDFELASGRTLWQELCLCYQRGVQGAEGLLSEWALLEEHVDERRFEHVRALLKMQVDEARWWRDASIAYFRTFAARALPEGVPEPEHDLEHYRALETFPVAGAPWLR